MFRRRLSSSTWTGRTCGATEANGKPDKLSLTSKGVSLEQKHSPDESEPREKEQPPLPAPTPATAAAPDPRTPAQQVLDLIAAMEKPLRGGASPAEAAPATPEPK